MADTRVTKRKNSCERTIMDAKEQKRQKRATLNEVLLDHERRSGSNITHTIDGNVEDDVCVSDDLVTRLGQEVSWEYNVFDLAELTEHPLAHMVFAMLKKYNLIEKMNLDNGVLQYYVSTIERGYRSWRLMPYHHNVHAADVTMTTSHLLDACGLSSAMTDEELLACIIAAAVHDVGHFGVNNKYLITESHPLAITYNDISVLENYHCATAFRIMSDPKRNFLKQLAHEQRVRVRKMVCHLVLATDFSLHFDHINRFNERMTDGPLDLQNEKDRFLGMTMVMKCADISHTAKPSHIHKIWSQRIHEEFCKQGDRERSNGWSVSPGMDRVNDRLAAGQQSGFLSSFAIPLYQSLVALFPTEGCRRVLASVLSNRDDWASAAAADNNSNNDNDKKSRKDGCNHSNSHSHSHSNSASVVRRSTERS